MQDPRNKNSQDIVKPFLKWAGGKANLADIIATHLPSASANFGAYFEPFLGGGALFFALKNRGILKGKKVILSDKNAELINAYKIVQTSPVHLLDELKILQNNHDKKQFYSMRGLDRGVNFASLDATFRAARFIYLNKTCFNGLCRYNAKGEFNTPMGSYKNPKIYDERLILNAHRALQGVQLKECDFALALGLAQRGDFVYLDPPYFPISKTSSFVGYCDSFLENEQRRLCAAFRELVSRGVMVLESNSSARFIREIYSDFCMIELKARRAINCKSDKRGTLVEVLIKGNVCRHISAKI